MVIIILKTFSGIVYVCIMTNIYITHGFILLFLVPKLDDCSLTLLLVLWTLSNIFAALCSVLTCILAWY